MNGVIYDVCLSRTLRSNLEGLAKQHGWRSQLLHVDCLASIDQNRFNDCLRLALQPVSAGMPIERELYQVIEELSHAGFKIFCCVDDLDQLSLDQKCKLLLAGSLSLLDRAAPDFEDELGRLLDQLFAAHANRSIEEANLKKQMKQFGIVGESNAMLSIWRWLLRIGPLSSLPVLISGETGTGKNLLVNALWQLDPERREGPLVVLNCSAINIQLAESELFGHRRGAFTGADRDREGLFRSANGGVLFLDEIGDLELGLQAKLLRVLEENRVLGVGQDREVPIRTRVVAATNRNLKEMVSQNKFREDLFHRLDILSIHVPPLRQRPDDLLPLLEHFLAKYQSLSKAKTVSVDLAVVQALSKIELPGNGRQLENIVRQVLVNKDSDSQLTLADLSADILRELSTATSPEPISQSCEPQSGTIESFSEEVRTRLVDVLDANGWNLSQSIEYCEKSLVAHALKKCRGIQSQAAKRLGITPRTLYSKIRKHNLLRH
jgi:transcriptional regulator with GAF, ATPase, and Fis domain